AASTHGDAGQAFFFSMEELSGSKQVIESLNRIGIISVLLKQVYPVGHKGGLTGGRNAVNLAVVHAQTGSVSFDDVLEVEPVRCVGDVLIQGEDNLAICKFANPHHVHHDHVIAASGSSVLGQNLIVEVELLHDVPAHGNASQLFKFGDHGPEGICGRMGSHG